MELIFVQEWDRAAEDLGVKWVQHPLTSRHKGMAKCLVCDHIWYPVGYSILRGTGCPKCAHRWLARERKVKKPSWDARAGVRGLEWVRYPDTRKGSGVARCKCCGYEFEITGDAVCRGATCPKRKNHP